MDDDDGDGDDDEKEGNGGTNGDATAGEVVNGRSEWGSAGSKDNDPTDNILCRRNRTPDDCRVR
jgi:hypothetical protein